jgi:hypothetical protein
VSILSARQGNKKPNKVVTNLFVADEVLVSRPPRVHQGKNSREVDDDQDASWVWNMLQHKSG